MMRAEFDEGLGRMEVSRAELRQALRGPCRATNSELRLRSPTTGLATYADVSVLCAPRQPHPEDPGAGVNPTLLVEVLSPSTEAYDRGEKFEHYQTFASLRDYVLVATGRNHIDHYARSADGSWALRGFGPGDRFTLSGVDVTLSVDAIYAGVEAIRETA